MCFSRAKRDNGKSEYSQRELPGPGHYLSQSIISCTSSYSSHSFRIRPESLTRKCQIASKELNRVSSA